MLHRLATVLLILAAPLSARSQTWIVSGAACPDVDFNTVQEAIDAASDGDTILIRSEPGHSVGSIDIFQKSLTLIAGELNQQTAYSGSTDVTVRGLLPSQTVSLIGYPTSGTVGIFENNQGAIWVEDSGFRAQCNTQVAPFFETVRIENCESISFINTDWEGRQAVQACSPLEPSIGATGQLALRVINSEVNLFECTIEGGVGGFGNIPPQFEPSSGNGGNGIRLEDSTLNLYNTLVIGGEGGFGGEGLPAPFCSDGGDGGSGIYLADSNSEVRMQGSFVLGGDGGEWTDPPGAPNGCSDGAEGVPFDGPGVGNITVLPGSTKRVILGGIPAIREGESVYFSIQGEQNDIVFLGVSNTFEPTFFPTLFGTSVIAPLKVIKFGTIGASGSVGSPLPIGDLTTPGQAITIYAQAYIFDSMLQLSLSRPASLSILDSSHDIYDGCDPTLWVDDDAPNDPGPNDFLVSDPLEDGSAAHPYDSIQQAIYNVKYFDTKILVADGSYTPNTINGYDVSGGESFTLESENGPENCILDGQGARHLFDFSGLFIAKELGLRGFTLTGTIVSAIIIKFIDVAIDNCVIENNTGPKGAALQIWGGGSVITNSILRNNVATNCGGAVYVRNGSTSTYQDPKFINCSIIDNVAPIGGGVSALATGIRFQGCTIANNVGGGIEYDRINATVEVDVEMENCIVWGNTILPQIIVENRILFLSYSNVQGGLAGISLVGSGALNVGPGFIDVDPTFVNPLAGDFHLLPGSPCIDVGDPAFVPQPGEVDIDGEPRLQGTQVELGSDERP